MLILQASLNDARQKKTELVLSPAEEGIRKLVFICEGGATAPFEGGRRLDVLFLGKTAIFSWTSDNNENSAQTASLQLDLNLHEQ